MGYPTTRKEAMATGAKYYCTGQPCKRGHIALRKTKGVCVECMKEDWQADNERRKTLPKSEAAKAAGRRYYEENRELVKLRANAQPLELRREYRRTWKKNNPDTHQAYTNYRRRRLRDAMPKCLSIEHRREIVEFYRMVRAMTKITGIKYTVDHHVPLQGKNFCGLHVPWNLKVLSHEANAAKGNTLPEGVDTFHLDKLGSP